MRSKIQKYPITGVITWPGVLGWSPFSALPHTLHVKNDPPHTDTLLRFFCDGINLAKHQLARGVGARLAN